MKKRYDEETEKDLEDTREQARKALKAEVVAALHEYSMTPTEHPQLFVVGRPIAGIKVRTLTAMGEIALSSVVRRRVYNRSTDEYEARTGPDWTEEDHRKYVADCFESFGVEP